ncbi:MAG: DNA translocase FtsK 4TM domain-containing protein [Candidatus Falkowbacteria bacterium]|nr:DNA translocase FtsK 4TM domain-containing protein [Candidatus Falkowbacteria bacterium]
MSKKNSKKVQEKELIEEPSTSHLELNERARKSIIILAIFAFGLLSLLGLFDLSGKFGQFIAQWLGLGFGFGRYLVPFFFLAWGGLLSLGKKHHIRFNDYLGLFLLFISLQTILHFFIDPLRWEATAATGSGGGYLGLELSRLFFYLFGFWGGVLVLACISLLSIVIVFNTSLAKIIGRESIWAKALRSFSGKSESREDDGEGQEEMARASASALSSKILSAWQQKPVPVHEEEVEEAEEIVPTKFKEAEKKVQEKIVWPKKTVKIDIPLELLNNKVTKAIGGDTAAGALKIKHTLENFGIMVEMGETKVGPTVTQYTFKPAEGVKVARITTLNNDLSLALAAHPIRIEAPIPGQSLVGVEVPNKAKALVGLREILDDDAFRNRKNNLMIALGKDVSGTSWSYDITKMPHLLVAGATNSGKSVCLNTIIVSLLYQNNPEDLRFIMVDPKRVELPIYNGIPHLLVPVITEVGKTINALKWCLNEMNRRYDTLNASGKKNIASYNIDAKNKMPYIVFVIDELADFMMTAGKEMEAAIIRLAQMSRAVGIHLILATQRPSVDVITGLIKANIPARIAFAVTSLVDSKTILDISGAEKLLGQGDMLLTTPELSKPKRIQGAYVSDEEIKDIINYIKEKSGEVDYLDGVTERQKVSGVAGVGIDGNHGDEDDLMEEARDIVVKAGKASTSLLQRRLSIGYGRAAKILDMMEEAGMIGPSNGSKPREILINKNDYEAGIPVSPVHSRVSAVAPDHYLGDEEGDDGVLDFGHEKHEEAEDLTEDEIFSEAEQEELREEEEEFTSNEDYEDHILEEIHEDEGEAKPEIKKEKKPAMLDEEDYFSH